MASYTRRDITGGAAVTTLTVNITSGSTSFTIADATGWPTAANGDFFVVLDRGNAGEEKIRCSARSSLTCTVQTSGRGSDGTTAAAHSSGVTAEHCLTALDLDEANYTVAQTVGKITTQGDIVVASAANTFARLAKGSSGLPLVAGASTLSYAALAAVGLASDSVTTVKILDANVTAAKLASLSVASANVIHEAWTAWTPSVSSVTGTITSASGSGAWYRVGRLITWHAVLIITTNGTGATAVQFTLPVNSVGTSDNIGAGRNMTSTGKSLNVTNLSASVAQVLNYDNTYPAASGDSLSISGNYEAAS